MKHLKNNLNLSGTHFFIRQNIKTGILKPYFDYLIKKTHIVDDSSIIFPDGNTYHCVPERLGRSYMFVEDKHF